MRERVTEAQEAWSEKLQTLRDELSRFTNDVREMAHRRLEIHTRGHTDAHHSTIAQTDALITTLLALFASSNPSKVVAWLEELDEYDPVQCQTFTTCVAQCRLSVCVWCGVARQASLRTCV